MTSGCPQVVTTAAGPHGVAGDAIWLASEAAVPSALGRWTFGSIVTASSRSSWVDLDLFHGMRMEPSCRFAAIGDSSRPEPTLRPAKSRDGSKASVSSQKHHSQLTHRFNFGVCSPRGEIFFASAAARLRLLTIGAIAYKILYRSRHSPTRKRSDG
jgi:hypothetical protein